MSPRFPTRSVTIIAAATCLACTALSAAASSSVAVTFQPNNPWTQEIGKVSRRDYSQDYTVAINPGKTLQINLVTRDPNVFFTVRKDGERKALVDTMKTGATSWSTPNPEAATYMIHVYVDPDAMQRGEVADYALQVGQYGQEDMRAPVTTVTFEENKPWVQTTGTLDSQSATHDYEVAIAAGQMLAVNLVTRNPDVHFKVKDQASDQMLVDSAASNTVKWSTPVDAAATYTVSVYADPTVLPPGNRAGYALQIGHYAQNNVSPAATGTAATPSPASAASAAAAAEAGSAGN